MQLQRRHDVIDNLVTVVRGYTSFEAEILTTIARTRGSPDDEQMHAATTQDDAQRQRASQLLALAEAIPDLKTDAQSEQLTSTLSASENQIASAREFYNEAVTVFRNRRGTFPYVLVAWLVHIPSFELFGQEAPLGMAMPVD